MTYLKYLLSITVWFSITLFISTCNQPKEEKEENTVFSSPDGHIKFTLDRNHNQLTYSVTYKDQSVIEVSPMVMTVDQDTITQNVAIREIQTYEANETYEWNGVHSTAVNHYNGAEIALEHKENTNYTLDVRVFNDAASFRFIVPGKKNAQRVPDETTVFALTEGSTVWYHGLRGHYESVHDKNDISQVPAGKWMAPPVTFKLPEGLGYAAITEANLKNYSGMALQADSNQTLITRLAHHQPVSYPYELRYSEEDIARLAQPASVEGIITTPWRVIMIGGDLNAMVNSDVVHNLNPAPDKGLFPQGINTEWIKPGRAVWKYLDGGGDGTVETMKDFSRLASELGFEHNILEGFWRDWSDEEIKALVEYSQDRHVGIWLWKHSKSLRDPAERKAFFQRAHDLGITGVKLDFFDHEAKEVIDLYQDILQETAELKLLVDFHGANKPTGESRTWPNELTREAIRGMEARRIEDKARHNATVPFTRFLAGHAEYTPVHFGERMGNTTWTHQIASAAIMSTPLLTYAAHPANILENPGVEMIKSIPSHWDETIVLPPSEIGEVAAFARRKDDIWFLAIMNGGKAKTINIPLTFLGEGNYKTLIVGDNSADAAAVNVENTAQEQSNTLDISLAKGGGFIARFTKEGNTQIISEK